MKKTQYVTKNIVTFRMQILNNTIFYPSILEDSFRGGDNDEPPKLGELYKLISLREKGSVRLLLFNLQHVG